MGRTDQTILMDDVSCNGRELSLQICTSVRGADCVHSEDAGVICTGKLCCKYSSK